MLYICQPLEVIKCWHVNSLANSLQFKKFMTTPYAGNSINHKDGLRKFKVALKSLHAHSFNALIILILGPSSSVLKAQCPS